RQGGLTGNPAYARLARQLPTPNSGSYYLDAGAIGGWLASRADAPNRGDPTFAAIQPLLGALGGLTGASGLPRAGWLEHVALLELRLPPQP
ncbi:MAG TPA: hypothetical protein VM536_00600, partial [Chloroflexia bacterium]|nr:hypothetical protein [Chloroflexia bacterium]